MISVHSKFPQLEKTRFSHVINNAQQHTPCTTAVLTCENFCILPWNWVGIVCTDGGFELHGKEKWNVPSFESLPHLTNRGRACDIIGRHISTYFCIIMCRHLERQWIEKLYGEAYSPSSLWGTEQAFSFNIMLCRELVMTVKHVCTRKEHYLQDHC